MCKHLQSAYQRLHGNQMFDIIYKSVSYFQNFLDKINQLIVINFGFRKHEFLDLKFFCLTSIKKYKKIIIYLSFI